MGRARLAEQDLFWLTMRGNRLLLRGFPLPRGIFGCSAPYLNDVAAGPALLMFTLSTIQVFCDATVNDLLTDLKVVFFPVSIGHVFDLSCLPGIAAG